jgi:MerR family redox-sensitive transcriptional activator SoxR
MSIGQVAQRCGLAPSAIRYYEKVGLLPRPIRVSRRRHYSADVIGRVRLVQVAREAGFTIAETRAFVAGFSDSSPPAVRWRTLAERKLAEIDLQMQRLQRMRTLLESGFHCRCVTVDDCAKIIGKLPPHTLRPSNPQS